MIAPDKISTEHPAYTCQKHMLATYRDLYAGGEQFLRNVSKYLLPRHKEPRDIYSERLARAFYENYVGSIVDWYATTLFRREAVILTHGADERGKQFLRTFAEDCDNHGTRISDFFRAAISDALVAGESYVLVDFPRCRDEIRTRADEDATGAGRAYLVSVRKEELINWQTDASGHYEWVVLRKEREGAGAGGILPLRGGSQWLYLDKHHFRRYEEAPDAGAGHSVRIVDEGVHAFARQGLVPLMTLSIPPGLWILNKTAQLQLEHFNKSNALSWALTMGLFATPVIYSDKEWDNIVGDSYYVQLGQGDRFGWTEPEGHVFQIAADNLSRLQEEIYRVSHLLSQAGGRLAGVRSQSGISKQRDFAITQEVLRGYGDAVKDCLKRTLKAIILARGDALEVEVLGLDEFDIGEFSDELRDAKRLLELAGDCKLLRKTIIKKLALKYLCDARQETKDAIAKEIDLES